MPVLPVILILALLIFVHELGHFLAARLQGIYANRFSIGFGPVLWRYQGKQTEYALRALPLGGFVGFPDDDPDSEIPPNDPNLLRNRPVMDRAIVISAGVIANLLFAYFVLTLQVGTVGIKTPVFDGVTLPDVIAGSVAEQVGLQKGDRVLSVNAIEFQNSSAPVHDILRQEIENHPNQLLKFKVQRQEQILNIQATPALKDGKGRLGIALQPHLKQIVWQHPKNPLEVFTLGAAEFNQATSRVVQVFLSLFSNFSQTSKQVAGPVEIVRQGASIAKQHPSDLFAFAALISINLAIINILPLPALDGGQLMFILFEAIFGKPIPKRFEESVMQTGLVMLLGLGVILIIRDTANWIGVIKQ
ncbi:MAG: RIP metalloprotease RseP [Synechococcales bacterium]|nr:RIP metalloprotease RseP [Synechococcales bacterium]